MWLSDMGVALDRLVHIKESDMEKRRAILEKDIRLAKIIANSWQLHAEIHLDPCLRRDPSHHHDPDMAAAAAAHRELDGLCDALLLGTTLFFALLRKYPDLSKFLLLLR
ncbi:hypothetical protein PG993_012730 [Apiospora rasikravindrae]|uniref:RNase III domain-containing protein n=1 Tax=Apiospora rasikravindrae TaxID=990691 RepID=A0ABR1RVR4_9PEZI